VFVYLISASHVIGVDLGGSKVRALIAPVLGPPVSELAEETTGGDAGAVVAQLASLCRQLASDTGLAWPNIGSVAVGVPGVFDGGQLEMAPNLPTFDGVDLAIALGEELGVEVMVENDVNMATEGEHRCGHGVGVDDVAGGRLQRGARGAAGEIGALPLGAGTVEQSVAGVGLAARFAALRGAAGATAEDVFEAAAAGEAAAAAVLDEQAEALAHILIAAQGILDPAFAVFGGGIGSRSDVVARVRRALPASAWKPPALRVSALGERAGVVGAVEVARERLALLAEEGVGA